MPLQAVPPTQAEENSWLLAIKWLVVSYLKNIWFIVRTTLPLMILAGILGVVVVTFIPLDTLSDILPKSPMIMVLFAMSITALVGVFLPVPITFDVIVTAVLMAAGMPVKYAMILLFTLGIFSIYSYLIVQQAISRKVALTLYLVIAAMGVVTGAIAHEYDKWYTAKKEAFLFDTWAQQEPIVIDVPAADKGLPTAEVMEQLQGQELKAEPVAVTADAGIVVEAVALNAPVAGDKSFTRVSGPSLGIDQPYQFSILRWSVPDWQFRGISSGVVHIVGWADMIATSERGVYLYANKGGNFIGQAIEVEGLRDQYVVNAAIVDIDNDGWQDIYYSTYRNGNFIIYNDGGAFVEANQVELPNTDNFWMTGATAFGDLDQDGDMDIVLGNWTLGSLLSRPNRGRESSTNVILWNNNGAFEIEALTDEPGETLTILISDYNGDGIPDLTVGNDFEVPDFFYIGEGGGKLRLIGRKDQEVERSTLLTMSMATADINNDLRQEMYLANASGTDNSSMQPIEDLCAEVEGTEYFDACQVVRDDQFIMHASMRRSDPFMCSSLSSPALAEQCIGMQLYNSAWWQNRPDMCGKLAGRFDILSNQCTEFFRIQDEGMGKAFFGMVPQAARRTNVLLVQTDDGNFVDRALEYNVREAGWAWNAQFADLDQDGWQDLYVANGMFFESTNEARESSHYFRNINGMTFADDTLESGLDMHAESSSYTYLDVDNDGDLDIISVEALGPVWAFINNETSNNAVTFELRDAEGNSFGIGSVLTVKLSDGTRQMRELRTSGGFISFNSPIVHFGIGQNTTIESVEVRWSTGEVSTIEGSFTSGNRYLISRQ